MTQAPDLTVINTDGTRPAVQVVNEPTTAKGLPALAVTQGDSTGTAIHGVGAGTLLSLRNVSGTQQFKVDNSGNVTAAGALTSNGNQTPVITGTNFGPYGFGVSNADTTMTANLLNLAIVRIPIAATLTGMAVENGGTATGNILVGIYSADGSALLASSSSTGMSGTFAVQRIAFTATYTTTAGTAYIFGVMFSSSSATAGSAVFPGGVSTAAQGGFTLPSSVTPPTTGGGPVTFGISY